MSLVYVGYVPHPPIIVPQIGKGEEVVCRKTIEAYRKLVGRIVEMGVETIIVVSPHAPLDKKEVLYLEGERIEGNFGKFGVGGLKLSFKSNKVIIEKITEDVPEIKPVKAEIDHGALVPLYFLNEANWNGKIIVMGMPLSIPEDYGRRVGQILNDSEERCAILASGDLSHRLKEDGPYGFHPSGPKFDGIIVKALQKDTTMVRGITSEMQEEAGECGYNSLLFALGAREGSVKVYSYEGPFGVGYAVVEIYRSSPIAGFARECLTHHLISQPFDKLLIPGEPLLKEKKGCFVTLKKDGELRGCIGTVHPVRENLASEIKHNAIAAGTQDKRFWVVQPEELFLLSFSVDVMGELEKIEEYDKLDISRYGVVVRSGGKVGLLLPHLEGVDTVERQVEIARQKAGIWPEEKIEMWRFEVERYYE